MNGSRHWVVWIGLCLIPLIAMGCVSMYEIKSEPSGAEIYVDGKFYGKTPKKFSLPNPVHSTMVVKKEGYKEVQQELQTGIKFDLYFSLESKPPASFVETMAPSWASIEIREGIEYGNAWASIVDLLVKQFDLEALSKENGYLRTNWLYSWTG
ncbi:MAG: PEGA domain-containing protein [Nitrospinae bacterium]|nr:PEGA domain-containing protein [Nitrospinota bacterium]